MSKRLPFEVKQMLSKARESALLAVEVYNKPATKFKSGGYVVLMTIAWTSLFHAVFIRKKIKPIYKEKDGRHYKRVNGELSYWELQTCVKKYFADKGSSKTITDHVFIPLRNKIEHKFMPELDINIFGECESLLLNFDKILEKEFGEKYRLRETLSFALQLFPTSKAISKSVEISKDSEAVMKYIKNYRNTTFGNDETWKTNEEFKIFVSSIGRIKDLEGNIYEEKADTKGAYVIINNEKYYVRDIMDITYGTSGMEYVDGNKYNNALSNLV